MGANSNTKGIILAGGQATRLYPVTKATSKQLLPIYDKPMIYYPLSVLMLAGIRDVLIISTPDDLPSYERLLGTGSHIGLSLHYEEQLRPEGIPQAFIIGKDFIAGHPCCLILGDNLFYGEGLGDSLRKIRSADKGATIFAYWVRDPERYGVVTFDRNGNVQDIVEKPQSTSSHWAVTGLYFYDEKITEIAAGLKSSARGEYEITDVNKIYLQKGLLNVEKLGRGIAWLDTGTFESLMQAAQFVEVIEQRQGLKIGAIEAAAFEMGFIDKEQFKQLTGPLMKSGYGKNLLGILKKS